MHAPLSSTEIEHQRLEAFLRVSVAPHLPRQSLSRLAYFGGMPTEGQEYKMVVDSLLLELMRDVKVVLMRRLYPQQLLGFYALLVERFKLGNCLEQAVYGAVKLSGQEDVTAVALVRDRGKDHAYVVLRTRRGAGWIYDPWLTPDYLISFSGHGKFMASIKPAPSKFYAEPVDKSALNFYTHRADKVAVPAEILDRWRACLSVAAFPKNYLRFLVAEEHGLVWRCKNSEIPTIIGAVTDKMDQVFVAHATTFLGVILSRSITVTRQAYADPEAGLGVYALMPSN